MMYVENILDDACEACIRWVPHPDEHLKLQNGSAMPSRIKMRRQCQLFSVHEKMLATISIKPANCCQIASTLSTYGKPQPNDSRRGQVYCSAAWREIHTVHIGFFSGAIDHP